VLNTSSSLAAPAEALVRLMGLSIPLEIIIFNGTPVGVAVLVGIEQRLGFQFRPALLTRSQLEQVVLAD